MAAKDIIASVVIAILILAPTTYFVLPILYPNMKTGVINSVYEEFDDLAYIADSVTTYELVNQTQLVFATKGGSSLNILFVMQTAIVIDGTMLGALQIDVALVVQGEGNRTLRVAYYAGVPSGIYTEIPADVTINYQTSALVAGTYTIGVYWKFNVDAVGTNYMIAYNPPNYEFTRSLLIQEIKN